MICVESLQQLLELFARNKRDGWDVWGNEIKSDIKLEFVNQNKEE